MILQILYCDKLLKVILKPKRYSNFKHTVTGLNVTLSRHDGYYFRTQTKHSITAGADY